MVFVSEGDLLQAHNEIVLKVPDAFAPADRPPISV
jgi:hypothetical protein